MDGIQQAIFETMVQTSVEERTAILHKFESLDDDELVGEAHWVIDRMPEVCGLVRGAINFYLDRAIISEKQRDLLVNFCYCHSFYLNEESKICGMM